MGCGVHVDLFSTAVLERWFSSGFWLYTCIQLLAFHATGRGAIDSASGGTCEKRKLRKAGSRNDPEGGSRKCRGRGRKQFGL